MKQKFEVTGMTCTACSAHVEKAMAKLEGVSHYQVNLLQNNMMVEFDENIITSENIIEAVIKSGYGANLPNSTKTATVSAKNLAEDELSEMKQRLIISFCFLVPLMYISMGHMMGLPLPSFLTGNENAIAFGMTQFLLTLPIMYVNRKFYLIGFKALFNRSPNMDTLVAVGSISAVIYGIFAIYRMGYGLGTLDYALVEQYHMDLYFESAGTILTLITVGKYLETRSKAKTSDAINKLIDLAPKTAQVLRSGVEVEIPVEEIVLGDVICIRAGGKIPVDGRITKGSCTVDESALTGESLPVSKTIDDILMSGTVSKAGYIEFVATKIGADTTLSQIIALVEEASSSKAPIAKLADKIASIFVPTVMTISVLTFIAWTLLGYSFELSLSMAISVLVISCPCALGLATPTAIMVGTGKGAENGILIKSAESLETLHKVETVVMDKTGTITKGKPEVTDFILINESEKQVLLGHMASLEKLSEHPLAEAIINYCEENKAKYTNVSEYETISGQGVSGLIENDKYLIGNEKLLSENSVSIETLKDVAEKLAKSAKTPLFVAKNGKLVAIVAVADVVKETSAKAVAELQAMDIEVVMLTGDNIKTAEALRAEVGIKRVVAEVLPADKEREIRKIQDAGKVVAMVGDGINDAPSLVRADVGIAIGAGTDIALESADIVLMHSDLLDVVTAIKLSKSVIKNIKENLFWAFFYNTIGIPLAAGLFYIPFGLKLNPMFAAACMSLSSVFVVTNALRLRFFKVERETNIIETKIIEEDTKMTKVMKIEGMMCSHCTGRVDKILNGFEGVSATVSLEENCAFVTMAEGVDEAPLVKAIEDAGYPVVSF